MSNLFARRPAADRAALLIMPCAVIHNKPFAAVFISDLHLHPDEHLISSRFQEFVHWAAANALSVYILGDFFHAWPGDDGLDAWSQAIADSLKWLSEQGVKVFFMHGNRDFLLGKRFADLAGITLLPEPTVIQLGEQKILLVHGDRYCTHDKNHQLFRKITRNGWFSRLFLLLPLKLRVKLVRGARQYSQKNKPQNEQKLEVVFQPMLAHMQEHGVQMLIHGHIHKPELRKHPVNKRVFSQYVLSDWDEKPKLLCYDQTIGFEFIQICK